MPETLRVNLVRPIAMVEILESDRVSTLGGAAGEAMGENGGCDGVDSQQEKLLQSLEQKKREFAAACQALASLISKLNEFYDAVLAGHKEEIARLSVEIARKILVQKVQKGDYEIEAIVREMLENAPVRQDVVVHLNPEDLNQCRKLHEGGPEQALAGVKFVPDTGIGRAECLLETPKGVVKSFIEEHLERIGEALVRVE